MVVSEDELHEVNYAKYCAKCKYSSYPDYSDECNDCLYEPMNAYSRKPVNFEPATQE